MCFLWKVSNQLKFLVPIKAKLKKNSTRTKGTCPRGTEHVFVGCSTKIVSKAPTLLGFPPCCAILMFRWVYEENRNIVEKGQCYMQMITWVTGAQKTSLPPSSPLLPPFHCSPKILSSSLGRQGMARAPSWSKPYSSAACSNSLWNCGWLRYLNETTNLLDRPSSMASTAKWPSFTSFGTCAAFRPNSMPRQPGPWVREDDSLLDE